MYHKISFDAEDLPPRSYYKGDQPEVAGNLAQPGQHKGSAWWKDPTRVSSVDLDKIPEFRPRAPQVSQITPPPQLSIPPITSGISHPRPAEFSFPMVQHPCPPMYMPPQDLCPPPPPTPTMIRGPVNLPPPMQGLPQPVSLASVHSRFQPLGMRPMRGLPMRPFLPHLSIQAQTDYLRSRANANNNFPMNFQPGAGGNPPIPPGYTASVTHINNPSGGPPMAAIVIKKKRKKKNRKNKLHDQQSMEQRSGADSKEASPLLSQTSECSKDYEDDVDQDRRSEPDLMKIQKGSNNGNNLENLDLIQSTTSLNPTTSCPDLSEAQKEQLDLLWNDTKDLFEDMEVNPPVIHNAVTNMVKDGEGGIQSESVKRLDQQVILEMQRDGKLGNNVSSDVLPQNEDDDDELFNRLLRDCVSKGPTPAGRAAMSLQEEFDEKTFFDQHQGYNSAGESSSDTQADQPSVHGGGQGDASVGGLNPHQHSAIMFDSKGRPQTFLLGGNNQQDGSLRSFMPRIPDSSNGVNLRVNRFEMDCDDEDLGSSGVLLRGGRIMQDTWKRLSTSSDSALLHMPKKACCSVM